MARNGSGTMTPAVDFTTEAASPPIEIAKLDTVLDDIADELTNSIAADGQTNPTANLKMNGFRHTNVGAAAAITDYVRLSEMIDQDHVFYVDSGSANTYAITPSPAIATYEEGQRFVFRATNANSGASTLNVNGLGAIAIQTADGAALVSGAIVSGGYYEVVYDANATPDRWVLMSMPSNVVPGNYALLGSANTFTANQAIQHTSDPSFSLTDTGAVALVFQADGTNSRGTFGTTTNHPLLLVTNASSRLQIGSDGNFNFFTGTVTTGHSSASEVGYQGVPAQAAKTADYTIVAADNGTSIRATSSCDQITIQADGGLPVGGIVMVIANRSGNVTIVQGTGATLYLGAAAFGTTGDRTIADGGVAFIYHYSNGAYIVSGAGVS